MTLMTRVKKKLCSNSPSAVLALTLTHARPSCARLGFSNLSCGCWGRNAPRRARCSWANVGQNYCRFSYLKPAITVGRRDSRSVDVLNMDFAVEQLFNELHLRRGGAFTVGVSVHLQLISAATKPRKVTRGTFHLEKVAGNRQGRTAVRFVRYRGTCDCHTEYPGTASTLLTSTPPRGSQ